MKNLRITVNGVTYDVQVEETNESVVQYASTNAPVVAAQPVVQTSAQQGAQTPAPSPAQPKATKAPVAGAEVIKAPMPGTIVSVAVNEGNSVKKGQVLVVLEAMKMENEIMAPSDGFIVAVHINKGDSVDSGTALVSLQ